jgi:hypothetical protein
MESFSVSDKHKIHVIGNGYFLLTGRYDPDQLWFDFMDKAIFRVHEQSVSTPKIKLVRDSFHSYEPEHRFQYVLSFREGQLVTKGQMNKLERMGLSTWDRTPSGKFYSLQVRQDIDRKDIIEWCLHNLKKRFHVGGAGGHRFRLVFESSVDAITAKLYLS